MIELVKKASNVELTTPIIVTGSGGGADLSNYYNKQEVDDKIAAIKIPDLAGYATEEYVQQQIDNIPAPDLSGYALKTEIPDVSGFQTEAQVNALINTALGVIENGTY